MTTPTKPRQLTYMERTARFPLDFSIDLGSEIKQVKVPAAWESLHLTRLGPFDMAGHTIAPRLNLAAAPVLAAFFYAIEKGGASGDILSFDGGYCARLKRGVTPLPAGSSKDLWGKQLSNHSRGTAVDLNAAQNPMGHPPAAAGTLGSLHRIAEIAHAVRVDIETPHGHIWPAGIVWGGDWKGAAIDPMHFEVGTWEPAT